MCVHTWAKTRQQRRAAQAGQGQLALPLHLLTLCQGASACKHLGHIIR